MPPLRKTNAELLISKGIEQKVPDVIIPDESLAVAENVDFSKMGIAKKRGGYDRNSNLVLNAGALDDMRRLGVRQRREVLCITETTTQIGSAAGVGNAGDTLFSYSEQVQKWIPRGKMPRPNLDVLWTSGVPAASDTGQTQQYVCGGIENYVCIAYQAEKYKTIRVVIFDVGGNVNAALREAPTVVLDTTFEASVNLIGWYQAGGKVWLIYAQGGYPVIGTDHTSALAFRPDSVSFDTFETVISVDAPAHAASTDGTDVFVALRYGLGGYEIRQFDSDLNLIASRTNNTVAFNLQEMALDARGGWVDLARHDMQFGNVLISRLEKNTLVEHATNIIVSATQPSAGGFGRANLQICTVSENNALVVFASGFWEAISVTPTAMTVVLVQMSTGSMLGFFNHMSTVPYAQPFIIDGRVFIVAMHTTGFIRPNGSLTDLTGTQVGEESFMCFQLPVDNLNDFMIPFPCAQWDFGNCVCKLSVSGSIVVGIFWMHGRSVYQSSDGSVYVLTNAASGAGESKLQWVPVPRLVRLEFGDAAHRWRHQEFHDVAAFAGGIPFVYDGTRTYEMATSLHQPIPVASEVLVGGSLPDGKKVFVRFASLHVDGNGRECWSQPSRTVELSPVAPNLVGHCIVVPPTTTLRPDLGNSLLGKMKLYAFASTEDAPNEFKVCCPPEEISPYEGFAAIEFFIQTLTESNTLMYTSGLELDNYPPPPCRSIVEHSGRLWALSSDSNLLYYTKPFNPERGAEFALGQWIPLPDKGTALASLSERLICFTHRSVLVVSGDGPDVTGTPADAFSRPSIVSQDYGCVEYCAAARTPMGVVFRGQQGFYLLTLGFDVQYIGGPVEDITKQWIATRAIVHDQRSACCRITGFNGERSEELCYWYDTKRWSMNLMAADVVDSIALGDNLLLAVDDLSVAVASRFRLGTRGDELTQDWSNDYTQTVETGWLSFNQEGTFKRVWRVYALVRSLGAASTVRIQVFHDWEDRVSSDLEFDLTSLDTEARNLRIHLKHQKIKAIKVRISATGTGIDIIKLGFELGMREGGPKEVRANSG